jgi:hypothetical protein
MIRADRIASQACPTCLDLYRLRARNDAAFRRARRHYLAALRTAKPHALSDLNEELKQTRAARSIIGYTIQTHQARQHVAESPTIVAAA